METGTMKIQKILVVDDQEENLKLLGHQLRAAGWQVSLAKNGKEVLVPTPCDCLRHDDAGDGRISGGKMRKGKPRLPEHPCCRRHEPMQSRGPGPMSSSRLR